LKSQLQTQGVVKQPELVKFARANLLTLEPVAASYEALNAMLAERCRLRPSDRAARHVETIGARLADAASLPAIAA
jgi:hypothetical protein